MTRRNKAQRNLNRTDRLTPCDVRIAGTPAAVPAAERAPPKPPTAREMRANNYAKVDTGAFLGDLFRWIPLFREELRIVNEGKRGRPFEYPDSLILWMTAYMAFTGGDFRGTAGLLGPVLGAFGLRAPSYTRFLERSLETARGMIASERGADRADGFLAVRACDNVAGRVRRVGVDSTGMSLSCANMWRRRKWKSGAKDRGWLHLHVLCDVDSGEMLAYAVTDSSVGDAPVLRRLVSAAAERGHVFEEVYADGAYSTDGNWIYLCREHGYRFVTSFKVNTAPTPNGCAARGEAARLWCSLPYSEWTRVSGYGTRWKCECVFSDFERIFPETVAAVTDRGMVRDLAAGIDVFNVYKRLRADLVGTTGNGVVICRRPRVAIYRTLYSLRESFKHRRLCVLQRSCLCNYI